MKTLTEALIGKHNIKNISKKKILITKKKDLRTGDLCLQRDGEMGIYVENLPIEYHIETNGKPTILFLDNIVRGKISWQHYPVKYLNEFLSDEEDNRYDVLKAVRGIFDPKLINNPEAVAEFLQDKNKRNEFDETA